MIWCVLVLWALGVQIEMLPPRLWFHPQWMLLTLCLNCRVSVLHWMPHQKIIVFFNGRYNDVNDLQKQSSSVAKSPLSGVLAEVDVF
jgi:hypothetical protein